MFLISAKFLDGPVYQGENPIEYLKTLWKYYNSVKFSGKLNPIEIKLVNANNRDNLGNYNIFKQTLNIHKAFFNSDVMNDKEVQNELKVTVLHEMCHQAVLEFNIKDNKDNFIKDLKIDDGHGPLWKEMAKKVGLPKGYIYKGIVFDKLFEHKKQALNLKHIKPKAGTYVLCRDTDDKLKVGYILKKDDEYYVAAVVKGKSLQRIYVEKDEVFELRETDKQLEENHLINGLIRGYENFIFFDDDFDSLPKNIRKKILKELGN